MRRPGWPDRPTTHQNQCRRPTERGNKQSGCTLEAMRSETLWKRGAATPQPVRGQPQAGPTTGGSTLASRPLEKGGGGARRAWTRTSWRMSQRPPGSSGRLPWPQALPAAGGRRASAPGSVAACAALRLAVLPHQHRPPAHGRSVRGLTSCCEGGHERGVATQRLAQKRGSEIQAPAVICSHPLRVGVHQPLSRDYRPIESICLLCGIFPTCC